MYPLRKGTAAYSILTYQKALLPPTNHHFLVSICFRYFPRLSQRAHNLFENGTLHIC